MNYYSKIMRVDETDYDSWAEYRAAGAVALYTDYGYYNDINSNGVFDYDDAPMFVEFQQHFTIEERYWDLTGDWVVLVADVNNHDMTITTQYEDGTFDGYGSYQDGPQAWNIENGLVDGVDIEMDWIYYAPLGTTYEIYLTGTIDTSDGSMSGTFTHTSTHVPPAGYIWETVEGTATSYYKPIAEYDLIGSKPYGLGQPLW